MVELGGGLKEVQILAKQQHKDLFSRTTLAEV
jgi:hypothetical protein